jgi:hypothetical protein
MIFLGTIIVGSPIGEIFLPKSAPVGLIAVLTIGMNGWDPVIGAIFKKPA